MCQVALVNEISDNVQDILNDASPHINDPTVAIFYSITSSQPGLSGIDLGNFLIKRVVKELIRDVPSVRQFCTLSPIVGFRPWLESQLEGPDKLLADGEADRVREIVGASVEALHDGALLKVILRFRIDADRLDYVFLELSTQHRKP